MLYKSGYLFLLIALLLVSGNNVFGSIISGNPKDPNPADTIFVYYLGGQSNMEGFGFNKDLPAELDKSFGNVWIFQGNAVPDNDQSGGLGLWTNLRPGNGTGFTSNGISNTFQDRFGVELSFGATLMKHFPGQKTALIKYSRGGSSLQEKASGYGTWNPDYTEGNGLNQYDHFLKTVRNATSVCDIDGDGRVDVLVPAGIIWMQGEADACHTLETAQLYKENLRQMMTLMRAVFRDKNLPVVIGLIADSNMDEDGKMMDYLEIVQQAQRDFVADDKHAALVDATLGYSFIPDKWHFTSRDFIDLGKQFAEAVIKLEKRRVK